MNQTTASPAKQTRDGIYPADIDNPDEWARFLAHYLDNRATNVVHNGIGLVALHIVDAISGARRQAVERYKGYQNIMQEPGDGATTYD